MQNKNEAVDAFNKQAFVFDSIYSNDIIVQYKRERIYAHLHKYLNPASHILELNAGTGEDAIYLAQKGHHIHATDIASNMQMVFNKKIKDAGLLNNITHELCSFTELNKLQNKGPFDSILSNFAGLNCTGELEKVLVEINNLLVPGGLVTLVVMPKFSLWEFMLLLKGNVRTALRRFKGNKGTRAHIDGINFQCWYYNASFIKKVLQPHFQILKQEGLCVFVPPSYMRSFPEKYPKTYNALKKIELKWKSTWPWKNMGDYYILTLQKK